MPNPTFTPGTWALTLSLDSHGWPRPVVIALDGDRTHSVAEVCYSPFMHDDAKLIHAAKDMLVALQEIATSYPTTTEGDVLASIARDAIDKATT